MNRPPITLDICLTYVIDEVAIGNPTVLHIFETVNQGRWINFNSHLRTAEVIHKHAIKYGF